MDMSLVPPPVRVESATLPTVGLRERFTLWSRSNRWLTRARKLAPFAVSAIGLWLCARFCAGLDVRALGKDLQHVGLGGSALLLVLAPVVGHLVHALGWRGLLPEAARPSISRTLAIFVAAQAGNELGAGVLGESLKVSELHGEHRAAALKAVLLDNLTSLGALFAVVVSLGAALGGVALSQAPSRSLLVVGAVLVALSIAVGVVVWHRSREQGSPRAVAVAFVAHYFGKLWIIAEFALVLGLLGSVTLRSSALLGLVSTVASAAGAAIPGQLGVLETALQGSASSCGLAACTLVSVAVLRRARSVLWVVLGALLFWQLRRERGRAVLASPAPTR